MQSRGYVYLLVSAQKNKDIYAYIKIVRFNRFYVTALLLTAKALLVNSVKGNGQNVANGQSKQL